jgi:GAF domain-containing protein
VSNDNPTDACAQCQQVLAGAGPEEWLPAERELVAGHLATCQRCQDARERFAATDAAFVRMVEREPPAAVLALLSPAAAAVVRDLSEEQVAASGHATVVRRLHAEARRDARPRSALRALLDRWWNALRALMTLLTARLAYGVRAAYHPVPTRVLTAHFRPRHRRLMHVMLAQFDMITGCLILLIVVVTILPLIHVRLGLLIWPVGILLYTAIKAWLTRLPWARRRWFESTRRLKHQVHALAASGRLPRRLKRLQDDDVYRALQFVLAALLLTAAVAFTIQVRGGMQRLQPQGEDVTATWLLFSLPILWLSRYSSMISIILMTGLATLSNVVLHLRTDAHLDGAALVTQTAWIIVVCMLPTILARYIAEMGAGMHAAVDVVKEIARIRADSEAEFINVAASIIARRMDYKVVNILLPETDPVTGSTGSPLRLVGSASSRGRRLAEERFTIPFGAGITGWAAAHRRERLVNDVLRDPAGLYVPHPLFDKTRAELAIPILVGNELVGVLDMQSEERYAFSDDDVLLLRGVVMHVGVALRHFQLTAAHDAYVSPQTTERLLRHRGVRPLLEEIVSVMREELGADLVVLYPARHPVQRLSDVVLDEPIWDGPLHTWIASSESLSEQFPQTAVGQVLRSRVPKYLTHAQHDEALIARDHQRDGQPSFVEREGVLSAAALPLRVHAGMPGAEQSDRMLGAIFVNYRRPLIFSQDYQEQCRALATLAAQALQKSQDYQEQVTLREEAAEQLRLVSRDLEHVRRLNRMSSDPLILVG